MNNSMKPKVGKFILDSLSIGMYSNPLMLIREYIQNSTDAIDEAVRKGVLKKDQAIIEIKIDGEERSLSIRDNGVGVPLRNAWATFHDIGQSEKRLSENRGFRGIGRLGGLGYCEVLKFTTKAAYEGSKSTGTWQCFKLRKLIKDDNQLDILEVIKASTDFGQMVYEGDQEDHFFEVSLHNLQSSRGFLLNVPIIKAYISEVTPVPYDKQKFSFADRIEKELINKVPGYDTYKIFLNGEQIFKPYSDTVVLRGDKKDQILDIEFIDLRNEGTPLAYGWIAKHKLLGSVRGGNQMPGIRVRGCNIQIGNKDFLSEFFRESRFNGYLLGELFTVDKKLIPNSRRDDFEDNLIREEFFNQFIRHIGLPYSKIIRQQSVDRNRRRAILKENLLFEEAKSIINRGYYAEAQKKWIINSLSRLRGQSGNATEFDDLISGIFRSKHIIDKNFKNGKRRFKNQLKTIAEIVYMNIEDKGKAGWLIDKIVDGSS